MRSISELVAAARPIEEAAVRAQHYCPHPTNYRQLLKPELAYRKLSHDVSSLSIEEPLARDRVPVQSPEPIREVTAR